MAIEKRIREIKQRIIAVLVLAVMFGLVFTTLNLNPNYVGAATTNVFVNITNGILSIDSSSSIDLGSMVTGNTLNVSANNIVINVKDFISDNVAWVATAYSTNFKNGASGTRDIPNSRFNILFNESLVYNIDGASCSETARGGTCALSTSCTVMNGTANAVGECRLNAVNLNLTVLGTDLAATYNATLTLTLSAS